MPLLMAILGGIIRKSKRIQAVLLHGRRGKFVGDHTGWSVLQTSNRDGQAYRDTATGELTLKNGLLLVITIET